MLTFLKGFDAFSDVFEGEYQQKKRIDLSGKTLFIKIFFSMFFFAIGFYITRNLIITVSIQCVLLFLITMTVDIPAVSEFTVFTVSFKIKRLISLFLDCFPLFINAFLFVFIYTFPKYIVDRNFPPEYQTFYNILFMPALIFNLLRAFMMNPVLTKLMQFWSDGNVKEFESELKKQVLLLMCLFIPVFIFGYFIGIPVLNLVYGVHLNEYKNMFIVFLCGGCLNALAMIFLNLGVIFRKQRDFMTGCIFTAIGSAFFTYLFVLKLNFEGAAWAYLASTFMLCVVFAVLVIYNVQKYSRV
jgi:O-antigen/teichoic acid export membrane protein